MENVVLWDTPELHLNASLESRLYNALEQVAPDNQYLIATHSLEFVNSVPTENDFKLKVELSTGQLFQDYFYWAVIIYIMLFMMGFLLLWNPRKRRAVEEPKDEGDKDAAHGAVVRQ